MVSQGYASDDQRRAARGSEDRPAVQASGPGLTLTAAVVLYAILAVALSILGSCMVAV